MLSHGVLRGGMCPLTVSRQAVELGLLISAQFQDPEHKPGPPEGQPEWLWFELKVPAPLAAAHSRPAAQAAARPHRYYLPRNAIRAERVVCLGLSRGHVAQKWLPHLRTRKARHRQCASHPAKSARPPHPTPCRLLRCGPREVRLGEPGLTRSRAPRAHRRRLGPGRPQQRIGAAAALAAAAPPRQKVRQRRRCSGHIHQARFERRRSYEEVQ